MQSTIVFHLLINAVYTVWYGILSIQILDLPFISKWKNNNLTFIKKNDLECVLFPHIKKNTSVPVSSSGKRGALSLLKKKQRAQEID